jgi:plasmid stabilization system protein ParE
MEKRKRVLLSLEFQKDIQDVFEYGVETFGFNAAELYKQDVMGFVYGLSNFYMMYPECRHLPTKTRIYRYIILESHLILYRIKPETIEVLGIFHSKSSISKIKAVRSVKI